MIFSFVLRPQDPQIKQARNFNSMALRTDIEQFLHGCMLILMAALLFKLRKRIEYKF